MGPNGFDRLLNVEPYEVFSFGGKRQFASVQVLFGTSLSEIGGIGVADFSDDINF